MKEPARVWIWAIFVVLLFLCVPYGFVGTYEPLIFGIPLWLLQTLGASFLLSGFTIYVVLRHWCLAPFILDEDGVLDENAVTDGSVVIDESVVKDAY